MAAFARSPAYRAVRRRIRFGRPGYGGASGRKSAHAIKIPRTSARRGQRLNATGPSRGVQRVSGSYYDGRRFREGTVGWEDDVVVEVRPGRARTPLAEGLIVPGLWNAHTHLGDAIVTQELKGTLEELVAPPHGLKHRVLAKAKDAAVIAAMRRAMATMVRTGTTGFADFREGGLKGLKLLYAAAAALPIQGIALGRPVELSYDPREVAAILRASDGIAVSSYIDWPRDAIEKLAADVRRAKKIFAIHCSERVREDIDAVLDLKPAFLVHMVHATDSDLERCADADVPIVVCPRSNAFFGMTPDIPRMLGNDVELRLGTDNAMINTPSLILRRHFLAPMASYEDVMSLSVRRGFLWPAVDLYGGFAGFYDYGHNGVLMRRRWEDLWAETFLGLSDNYYLIDTTTILPEAPLRASGHVDHFSDLLVTCTRCGEAYRGDQLLEATTHEEHEGLTPAELDARIRELKIRCPNCKGELGPARPFNMMFPLEIGPTGKDRAYLRPETAQGVYLNFKREFEALRRKLPMGLAIVGRAYRNEISPRQGAYRMREFLQAELQIFFDPVTFADGLRFDAVASTPIRIAWAAEKNQPGAHDIAAKDLVARDLPAWYVWHLLQVQRFYLDALSIPRDAFRLAELDEKERAFYNQIHFDIQVRQESLGGFQEVGGVHYRTDHDLKGHEAGSHTKQSVTVGATKLVPHVLELSFGVDRNVWALLDLSYAKGDRVVLRLPARIAPVPVAVFPLVNKDGIPERAEALWAAVRKRIAAFYDDSGSIGRRYARIDEIGTPFSVTVDHETLEGKGVTVRERDSQKQFRVSEGDLADTLERLLSGAATFPAESDGVIPR